MFDYEKIIFDCLIQTQSHDNHNSTNANTNTKHKHLWIKKATGLGITEFILRFMAWLCLKDKSLSGSQMCIVTGPRIDLAIGLIDRMKRIPKMLFVPSLKYGKSARSDYSCSQINQR
jgi:late competence protein required for DNA uptake (superfamily II DNA/RNA helicase)